MISTGSLILKSGSLGTASLELAPDALMLEDVADETAVELTEVSDEDADEDVEF